MDAKLRYVEIKKLFGQYDVEWNIEKDTTVLVGQNGSGKTTILNILRAIFLRDSDESSIQNIATLISKCTLKFSNSAELLVRCNHLNQDAQARLLLEFLKAQIAKSKDSTDIADDDPELLNLLKQFEDAKISNVVSASSKGISDNEIAIEFISTVNMSANAMTSLIGSDGKQKNYLDDEIERAISAFQRLSVQENYSVIKDKVVSVLNDFFSATQKNIELSDTDFVIKNLKKKVLKLSQLSAGERQIIYIVFKVATAYFNEALILMDEPEISLHLEWQEKLLKNLREINDKSQMIVVTHSPAIIMDGWMDSYVDIQTILKPIKDDE